MTGTHSSQPLSISSQPPHPRIVITGMGVVSSIGVTIEAFANGLKTGKCVVSPITTFDTEGYPFAHATEIQDFGPSKQAFETLSETRGRSASFAILAAREALNQAGLDESTLASGEAGVVLGTTNGESQRVDSLVQASCLGRGEEPDATYWESGFAHSITDAVAEDVNLVGPSFVIATACAAGNYAIGQAFDVIASGESDVMLCGGVDSVCRKTYSGFFRLGAVTSKTCSPFDKDREGILTGEGAGVLVMERLDHALARGANILAEVMGYATNCDAQHMVAPNKDSIARCIATAHERAGVLPSDIDFICAHGTGTPKNDVVEVGAIRLVFGEDTPPTVSIKSMLGHSMGAASAMGAIACVLGMRDSFVPPTMNFKTPDPECLIDCVPNEARFQSSKIVENHGFAFGGNNAILILRNGADVTTSLEIAA